MEEELKYGFSNDTFFEKMKEELLEKYAHERIEMGAVYYDTADNTLRNSGAAMRIRRENDKIMLTVKSGGGSDNGLHQRKEWNVSLRSEDLDFDEIINSEIDSTDSPEEFVKLLNSIKNKALEEICRTVFTRYSFIVCKGKNKVEICLDSGEILADGKESPILEAEFEVHSGNVSFAKELATEFCEKYSMFPENRSKFARGLELHLSK